MGLTFKEFLRTLPAAVAPLSFEVKGRSVIIGHPAGRIEIGLGDTMERRIASIRLPVTRIEFSFAGLNADDRQLFMERFDLYFHRGGG